MAMTLKHKEYTDFILSAVRSINPHKFNPNNKADRLATIYAYGFLASYLANILAEDPILFKQFKQHIQQLQQEQQTTNKP